MEKSDKKAYVDINNAHGEKMLATLQQIIEDGVDPFSLEHMQKYHERPILEIGKYWFVTENQWPYPNTRVHLLFITVEYAETFKDIPSDAFAELEELCEKYSEQYGVEGGALCMRFGKTSMTGATVKHLHAQLIEANMEGDGVKFPIKRKS